MEIDTEKFIDAAARYIYSLDDYPVADVRQQISVELEELLGLNDPNVLERRCEYFATGVPDDYLNKVINTDEGEVIAGIRHLAGDRHRPFVFVWPSFQIVSIDSIVQSLSSHFQVFDPRHYSYFLRPDCNTSEANVYQQRFLGRLSEMPKTIAPLVRPKTYYEHYQAEYEKFHKEYPQLAHRVVISSEEVMEHCLKQNLLFHYVEDNQSLGLIAAERITFLGQPAIHLVEILVNQSHRGRGYAHKLLSGFAGSLNDEYFYCEIDADNNPSTKAALRSGQQVFSQELFIPV